MLSGRNSRSNSTGSRADRILPDPVQDNLPPELDLDTHSSMGDIEPEDYEFTRNHLLGSILLKLAHDNTMLARKCNVREMETNIGDICQDFHNAMMLEDSRQEARTIQASAKESERLLQRELNSHILTQEIEPPEYFSPVPTLTTPHKMAENLKLFPNRNNRFSGDLKETSMTIVEFLSLMKAAQKQCKLSLDEFQDALLTSTTGKAHLLLKEWIDNGQNMSSIFHSLTLHFDKRLSAEEARVQLAIYNAPKTANLADVIAHIQLLVGRISIGLPDQASRKASYNHETITALIKSLPPYSATTVQNTFSQLSAKMGRACEATELTRALNMYRHSIDTDIKNNGVDNSKNRMGRQNFVGNRRNKNPNWRQFSSYSIQQNMSRPPYVQNNGKFNQFSNLKQDFKNTFMHKNLPPRLNMSSGNNERRQVNGRFKKNPIKPRTNYSNMGCSLCGLSDHKASQGCPNMKTDDGRLYKTLPSHSTCSLCPGAKKNTLNHPPMVCPFRKGGPLANSN